MKAILLAVAACMVAPFAWAQSSSPPARTAAVLRQVTVYRTVAELRQTAELSVPAGSSEVRLTGLAPHLLTSSLQIEVTNAELLSSAVVALPQVAATPSDSAVLVQNELFRLNAELEGTTAEKEFLERNNAMPEPARAAKSPAWTTELQKSADFFRRRRTDVALRLGELGRAIARAQARLQRLQQAGNDAYSARQEVVLRVQAPKAGPVEISLRYVVPGASWTPRHDVRLDEPRQARAGSKGKEAVDSLLVVNRALVRNTSGLDWKNVRMSLLTTDPSLGAVRPALQPWTLRYSGEALNEGRVDNYAARPGARDGSDDDGGGTDDESGDFGDRYGVAEGVTIPSGSAQLVRLGSAKAPATLEYLTVPKLDPGVFLLAKVTGWEKLKLLADSANVYLRGAYLGRTFLNTQAFGDTLELALGRDPLVTVNRTKREDYSGKAGVGKRLVKLNYEITVKNLHKIPVNLRVLDQIPVPQEEEIKVTYLDSHQAKLDEDVGRLTWRLTLAPNESRKLPFGFEIEYPKNKSVNLHRNRRTYSPKFR